MVNFGGKASFQGGQGASEASKLWFSLNSDDLSYSIIQAKGAVVKSADGKTIDWVKTKKSYLQVVHQDVGFSMRSSGDNARWYVTYDQDHNAYKITNKATDRNIVVDENKNWLATVSIQTIDHRGLFRLDRPHYQSVGCFKNKISKQLEYYMTPSNTMSTDKCYQLCEASNKTYTYFGLTIGSQCYCGTKFWAEKAPYTDCAGKTCNNRKGEPCGEAMRTLIFKKITGEKPIIITSDVPAVVSLPVDPNSNLYSCDVDGLSEAIANQKQADSVASMQVPQFKWCCREKWSKTNGQANFTSAAYTSQKCPNCDAELGKTSSPAARADHKTWCCKSQQKLCPTAPPTNAAVTDPPTNAPAVTDPPTSGR